MLLSPANQMLYLKNRSHHKATNFVKNNSYIHLMKKYFITFSLFLFAMVAYAADAVNWSFKLADENTAHPAIEVTAVVNPGYHLYAIDNPSGGCNPLEFSFNLKGCKLDGNIVADKEYITEFDDIFELDHHFYTGTVTFTQQLIPTDSDFTVDIELKGQACSDSGCIQVAASKSLSGTAPIVQ